MRAAALRARALVCALALPAVASPLRAQSIHQAVRDGETQRVAELLKADPSLLEQMDSSGMKPIHIAVRNARVQIVELILSKTANVDVRSRRERTRPDGATPAQLARRAGHEAIAEYLKTKGATAAAVSFPEIVGPYLGQPCPDGRFFFFVTDGGPSNRADIYWVETKAFERLRPS